MIISSQELKTNKDIEIKILLYLFVVVTFGLLQVWLACLYFYYKGLNFSLWQLLTQYGIFFFATSLTASSWWKYCKLYRKVNHIEFLISTLGAFTFILYNISVYNTGLKLNDDTHKFEFVYSARHQVAAFLSLIFALAYGVFTEKKSLTKKRKLSQQIE